MFQFEEVHELYGNHLEDYTRVMFHVNHADKNGNGNTINTNGNTIAVILTCNAKLFANSHLSYDIGVDYNNSREYLDFTKLSKCLTYCASSTWYLCIYKKQLLSIILQKRQNQTYYCNEQT